MTLALIAATVLFYLAGVFLQERTRSPLANPTLIGILGIGILLRLAHIPYPRYFAATQSIHFLLGPATVALAIPVVLSLEHIRRGFTAIVAALLAGCITGMVSAYVLVKLCGGDHLLALSMLPKSTTTPIAMGVSAVIGGTAPVTAVFAILGGILAAVVLPWLLKLLKVDDPGAVGLAAGTGGSGIAAASVIPLGPVTAAFAGIAVGVNGLFTAILAPLAAKMLSHL